MTPKDVRSTTVSSPGPKPSDAPTYRTPKNTLKPLPVFAADGTIEKDASGNEIYQWHKRGPHGEWILVAVGPLPK